MPKNMTLEEWSKRSKALYDEYNGIPEYREWILKTKTSRLNQITHAVNRQIPIEKVAAELENNFEKLYYEYLWRVAELHVEAYGDWPVFDMGEIEWDDPVLDRYSPEDSAENWVADRKVKREKA